MNFIKNFYHSLLTSNKGLIKCPFLQTGQIKGFLPVTLSITSCQTSPSNFKFDMEIFCFVIRLKFLIPNPVNDILIIGSLDGRFFGVV